MRALVAFLAFILIAWSGVCLADEERVSDVELAEMRAAQAAVRAAKAEHDALMLRIYVVHHLDAADGWDEHGVIRRAPKSPPKPAAKPEPKK